MSADLNHYKLLYEGKSKILYQGPEENHLVMRFKDTATAYNGEKKEELPGKGRINRAISDFLFSYLEEHGIATHLIEVMDENTVHVKNTVIFPIEVIVRNRAAGSFSKRYGIAEGEVLHNTVVEFSYKNDSLGDPLINDSQITALCLAEIQVLDSLRERALAINKLLCPLFLRSGIILVDFKLEFGRAAFPNGEILLCDEISPDSCRLWDVSTGAKLDKDRFRRDLGHVIEAYRDVYQRLIDGKKT